MNPGLTFLLRKLSLGNLRYWRRRARGVKGFLVLFTALAIIALIVLQQQYAVTRLRDMGGLGRMEDSLRLYAPPGMLILVLLSLAKGALYFKPAEVQFLFPAPISRRQLLVYHVVSRLRIHVFSAVWLSLFLCSYAPLWYAVPLAAFLFFAFMQLLTQASGILLATADERLAQRVRRLGFGGIALLLLSLFAALKIHFRDADLKTITEQIARAPLVHALGWLTRPFLEVYLAPSPDAMLRWSGVALAIVTLLFLALIASDVAYQEDALRQAGRLQQALKRMRSGGTLAALAPSKNRLSVPSFPSLGGAGTIAWRHCQEMVRNLSGLARMGIGLIIWIGTLVVLASGERADRPNFILMPLAMVVLFTPIMTGNTAFDFRRDLDRMALLKSLPLSESAIAAGQIFPQALLCSVWQMVAVLAVAISSRQLAPELMLAIFIVLPPLDWIMTAADNLLFLLMPYRPPTRDPGRIPFMGRMMVVTLIKMIMLIAIFALAAAAAWVAWSMLGQSLLLTALVVAGFLASAAWPLTHLVGVAFRAFDVTRDIPA